MNGVLDFVGFFLYLAYRIVMIPIVAILYLFLAVASIYGLIGFMMNYAHRLVGDARLLFQFIKQAIQYKRKTVVRIFSH